MKQGDYKIEENIRIAEATFRMRLSGDTTAFKYPGQFVNLLLPGRFLRRPIAVHDWNATGPSLIYKRVGQGTTDMADMLPGTRLDLLVGLGNGFDTQKSGPSPLLAGGGVGAAPLYALAKALLAEGKRPQCVLGFNTASEVFCLQEFEKLGLPTFVATVDGSFGVPGFITELLPNLQYSFLYACGPEPMLHALCQATACPAELSLEARMGCGFGACMGCSIKTNIGSQRICKDGPVFDREVLAW